MRRRRAKAKPGSVHVQTWYNSLTQQGISLMANFLPRVLSHITGTENAILRRPLKGRLTFFSCSFFCLIFSPFLFLVRSLPYTRILRVYKRPVPCPWLSLSRTDAGSLEHAFLGSDSRKNRQAVRCLLRDCGSCSAQFYVSIV